MEVPAARSSLEVAGVGLGLGARDLADEGVEDPRTRAFKRRIGGAVVADAIDDVHILTEGGGEHVGDDLGWVLQVRVNRDDVGPARVCESS